MSTIPPDKLRRLAEKIAQGLADQGLMVEAGWIMYRSIAGKSAEPIPEQDALKEAFFAGCEYLFTTMMNMMEPGTDESPADLRRMDQIWGELEPFQKQLALKYGRTVGRA